MDGNADTEEPEKKAETDPYDPYDLSRVQCFVCEKSIYVQDSMLTHQGRHCRYRCANQMGMRKKHAIKRAWAVLLASLGAQFGKMPKETQVVARFGVTMGELGPCNCPAGEPVYYYPHKNPKYVS